MVCWLVRALWAFVGCVAVWSSLSSAALAASAEAGRVRFVKEADTGFEPWVRSPSAEQARWMREHFFRQKTYAPYFDSRTSWYPNAWTYRDLYAVYVDGRDGGVAGQHPDWVLKDPQGRRLYIPYACSGGSCPQYAADVGNPAFRAWWIEQAKRTLAHGYKGLFVDDVNLLFKVSDGHGNEVAPLDPRTGKPMTATDWRRYVAEFVEQISREVRAAYPGIEIAHNPIWFAGHDDPYTKRALLAADYIDLERGVSDNFSRGGGTYGLETFFAHVDWLHQHGKAVVYDSYADTQDAAEYNLAAYFLTAEDRDGFRTNYRHTPDNWWAAYDVQLGAPTGPRTNWNGLLRRDFQNGYVLLNQPQNPTKTLTLPPDARAPDNTPRTTTTLPPASGRVILTGAPAPPPDPPTSGGDDPKPSGENKAAGQATSASSTERPELAPERAADGQADTRWSSAFRDGEWWQVDLGRVRSIDTVRLGWEHAYASRYRILTSVDGQSFDVAAEVSLDQPVARTSTFAVRRARYVRVQALERATPYGISLWEAEVYGPADSAPPPPPADPAQPPATTPAPAAGPGGASGGASPRPRARKRAPAARPARLPGLEAQLERRGAGAVAVSGRAPGIRGSVGLSVSRRVNGTWKTVARRSAVVRGGRFSGIFRGLAAGQHRVKVTAAGVRRVFMVRA